MPCSCHFSSSFFFNHTATTEIYTLSLHDALPILNKNHRLGAVAPGRPVRSCHRGPRAQAAPVGRLRSEEHTSELQSHHELVCRLLLEKKNNRRSRLPRRISRRP